MGRSHLIRRCEYLPSPCSSRLGTASTSAPAASSSLMIRRKPSADARQSAVRPSWNGALTFAPSAIAARTPSQSLLASAASSGPRCGVFASVIVDRSSGVAAGVELCAFGIFLLHISQITVRRLPTVHSARLLQASRETRERGDGGARGRAQRSRGAHGPGAAAPGSWRPRHRWSARRPLRGRAGGRPPCGFPKSFVLE